MNARRLTTIGQFIASIRTLTAVDNQGHWPGIDQLYFHRGLKSTGFHVRHPTSDNLHEFLVESLGLCRWSCIGVRRPAPFAAIAVQGELRHHQQFAAANEIADGANSVLEIAGSLRRRKETVHDVDILLSTAEPQAVMQRFVTGGWTARVLGSGEPSRSQVPATAGGFEVEPMMASTLSSDRPGKIDFPGESRLFFRLTQ